MRIGIGLVIVKVVMNIPARNLVSIFEPLCRVITNLISQSSISFNIKGPFN